MRKFYDVETACLFRNDDFFSFTMKTILIFEDNKNLKFLYKEELEEEGYKLLFAKNIEETSKIIEEKFPDLLIVKDKTPTMSSYMMMFETTKAKGIPVIIHTVFPLNRIGTQLRETVEHVKKTPNFEHLKNKINELLDNGKKNLTANNE